MKNSTKVYFFLLTYTALFVYGVVGYMLVFGIIDWYNNQLLLSKLFFDSAYFNFIFTFYLLIPAYAGMKAELNRNK